VSDVVHLHTGAIVDAKSPGEAIRLLIEPHKAEIVAKLVELAKLGDPKSQALALAYVAPPARGESERVNIPGFKEATGLQAKAEAVIAAAATGHCTAEAAERLLRVLDVYARAVVADDHERRLAAIEAGKKAPVLAECVDHSDLA
jgi:hypothetical protein